MEIALNTLLVTFLIQLKVNGKCGREPATARSTPLHFNYTVSRWLASMSPHLLYVTMHSCQYLRSTSCGAETCHKPKHHEILRTTLNQAISGP